MPAAAALIIALVNWTYPADRAPDSVVRDPAAFLPSVLALRAETAERTAPLEEKLKNPQSDPEKARASVERDLHRSF